MQMIPSGSNEGVASDSVDRRDSAVEESHLSLASVSDEVISSSSAFTESFEDLLVSFITPYMSGSD